MVAHSFNPSTQDVETGELGLQRASQGYKEEKHNCLAKCFADVSKCLFSIPLPTTLWTTNDFALWQGMWTTL